MKLLSILLIAVISAGCASPTPHAKTSLYDQQLLRNKANDSRFCSYEGFTWDTKYGVPIPTFIYSKK
jgi:hypothetical protein